MASLDYARYYAQLQEKQAQEAMPPTTNSNNNGDDDDDDNLFTPTSSTSRKRGREPDDDGDEEDGAETRVDPPGAETEPRASGNGVIVYGTPYLPAIASLDWNWNLTLMLMEIVFNRVPYSERSPDGCERRNRRPPRANDA